MIDRVAMSFVYLPKIEVFSWPHRNLPPEVSSKGDNQQAGDSGISPLAAGQQLRPTTTVQVMTQPTGSVLSIQLQGRRTYSGPDLLGPPSHKIEGKIYTTYTYTHITSYGSVPSSQRIFNRYFLVDRCSPCELWEFLRKKRLAW